jgi:hypothetical protein
MTRSELFGGASLRTILFALAIVGVLTGRCAAQGEACTTNPAIKRAAGKVIAVQRTLLAIPVDWRPMARPQNVPRGGIEAIATLKDRISDLVQTYVTCLAPDAPPDAERIRRDFTRLVPLMAAAKVNPNGLTSDTYGAELTFAVQSPPDRRRLIAITATFDMPCADDTMLMIFAPLRDSWQEVIRRQSTLHKDIGGAFAGFQYGISPAKESGSWFVVTTHIEPWCTSNWTEIDYTVLRPADRELPARTLLSQRSDIFKGDEDFGKLTVGQNDFVLTFKGQNVDTGLIVRSYIFHFSVIGDSVKRMLEPIAASPRNFVDDWLAAPWATAAIWTKPRNLQKLKRTHERIYSSGGYEFQCITRCTGSANDFEVALCTDQNAVSCPDDQLFYFRTQGNHSYSMIDGGNEPDPKCDGADISESLPQ